MSEKRELWRECIRWLRDVGVLSLPPGLDLSDTPMVDFANMLRDGVLLCRLLNELEPYCIDEKAIQLRPHMSEFTCHKCVTAFLGACQSHFHLKEEDLFEASDLIRLRDFGKVLSTLSMLSYSDSAMRKGFKPFPLRVRPTVPTRICPQPEEEAIYKSLLDDVETVDLDSAIYDVRPYVRNDDEPQLIYDRIVCRKDSQRKHDVWSTFSPQSKREHCIKELLDTEQNYVEKALNMIINKFYEPLQKIIEEHDHKTIFMNIIALWNLHHSFYSDLRQAVLKSVGLSQVSDGRPSSLGRTIGDVFLLHKEKFIAYGPYCMGLDESRMKILDLEKNDITVRAKIAECTSSVNDNQFKLQDLLCLPMQRVLKYHILLSEMIKSTSVDAPDRKSLESAKEAMDDVNSYINEMKRDNETRQLIMEIQNSITDLSMPGNVTLMEYGRLNADGEVRLSESTASQSGKMKQRHVFLFDKVLIICRANRNNTYTYKSAYILCDLQPSLENTLVDSKMGTISRKLASGQHFLYLLVRESRSCPPENAKQITLSFKSSPQREKWLHQFESARDNIVPSQFENTGHKLRYESFSIDEPHKCSVCCKFLKGLFYQGYSCDHCRNLLHKSCIVLRPCSGSRHSSAISYSGSFNSRSQFKHNSLGGLVAGDQVITLSRMSLPEPGYLGFEKDDVIEIIQAHGNGTFTGCLVNSRQKCGLLKSENVRRLRTNSTFGVCSPHDSPVGSRISRKESTVLPKRLLSNGNTLAPQQDYVNTEIGVQSWYMNNLERADAEKKLKGTPNGTFLVRYSNNRQSYAVSISYEGEVKHTVVEQSEEGMYYLDEGYIFNSIVELVNYYKEHNLCESFNSLNTTLKNAYRECKVYRVIHNYGNPDPKFLALNKGDVLTLIDTTGEDRGWWKGQISNRIGYFPLSYVEPLSDHDD